MNEWKPPVEDPRFSQESDYNQADHKLHKLLNAENPAKEHAEKVEAAEKDLVLKQAEVLIEYSRREAVYGTTRGGPTSDEAQFAFVGGALNKTWVQRHLDGAPKGKIRRAEKLACGGHAIYESGPKKKK